MVANSKKSKNIKLNRKIFRESLKNDNSPCWDNCDIWPLEQYKKTYYDARGYYEQRLSQKDYKKLILQWLIKKSVDDKIITDFKNVHDKHCTQTIGIVAACLLKGMLEYREDFNNGKNLADFIYNSVLELIESCDVSPVQEEPSIHNVNSKVKDEALRIACKIDEVLEQFWDSPNHDVKFGTVSTIIKVEKPKATHARILSDFYKSEFLEFQQLLNDDIDPQLKEAYCHLTKKQIKNFLLLHKEIQTECQLIIDSVPAKVIKKKVISKEQLVSNLKFRKVDEKYNISSIDPIDIIGAKELWCFSTKTRKLIRYVSVDDTGFTINKTALINFDSDNSKSKMLKSPVAQLKEFNGLAKNRMLAFFEQLPTMDTIPSGKFTDDVVLLKRF